MPENGLTMALFDSEMKVQPGQWRVVAVTPNPAGRTNVLTLDRVIPPTVKGGFMVDLNVASAWFIVRNNQFLNNRARGALLQTAYGLVEGNTFSGQTRYALYLTTFAPEGPGAQDVVVSNNKISDTGVGGGPGAIILSRQGMTYTAQAHNPLVNQNIVFRDNVISDVPGPAFYVSSANDVVLQGNILRNTNTQLLQNRWNGAGDLNAPIVINDARNILLLRNTIPGGRPILVDPATTSGIRVSGN